VGEEGDALFDFFPILADRRGAYSKGWGNGTNSRIYGMYTAWFEPLKPELLKVNYFSGLKVLLKQENVV